MPFKHGFLSRAPFPVTLLQTVAAGSLLTTNSLFNNPPGAVGAGGGEVYEVLDVNVMYDVLSTSGTLDIRNVAASTAFTGGSSLLTATMSLSGTARISRKGSLVTTRVTRQIMPGSALTAIFAGTMTNLVGLSIVVWLQAMRGIRSR